MGGLMLWNGVEHVWVPAPGTGWNPRQYWLCAIGGDVERASVMFHG